MRHFCRSIPLDGVPDVHSAHDGCAVISRRSAPMAVGFAEERAALDLVKVDGSECRACGLDSDTLGHRLMEFSPSAGLETTVFSCPGSRSGFSHAGLALVTVLEKDELHGSHAPVEDEDLR